jgi:hypothetical protein
MIMIKTINVTKVFRTDEVETTALNNVGFKNEQRQGTRKEEQRTIMQSKEFGY